MTLEEAIQKLREAIKSTQNEYEKSVQDGLQLLGWLESCKDISESHPEMCKKIDRLEGENMRLLEYTVCRFQNLRK